MSTPAKIFSTLKGMVVALLFSALVVSNSSVAVGQYTTEAIEHDLSALLSKSLGRPIQLHPTAMVEGCVEAAAPEVVNEVDKRLTIRRQLREKDGKNGCTPTERFKAGSGSVRWEIEVQGLAQVPQVPSEMGFLGVFSGRGPGFLVGVGG